MHSVHHNCLPHLHLDILKDIRVKKNVDERKKRQFWNYLKIHIENRLHGCVAKNCLENVCRCSLNVVVSVWSLLLAQIYVGVEPAKRTFSCIDMTQAHIIMAHSKSACNIINDYAVANLLLYSYLNWTIKNKFHWVRSRALNNGASLSSS